MDLPKFFRLYREKFNIKNLSKVQAENIETVLFALTKRGVDLPKAAYILATAHHESMGFGVLEEIASGRAYEGRQSLGNTQKGDGVRFKGRGFVQITGRRNYTDWAKRTGVDIVAKPEKAADPKLAATILIDGMLLGTFTGKKVSDYVLDGTFPEYTDARRVVNGTDKAFAIASHARSFRYILLSSDYSADPAPAKPSVTPTVAVGTGLLVAIGAAVEYFFDAFTSFWSSLF